MKSNKKEIGIDKFLQQYPSMTIKPSRQIGTVISGTYGFYVKTTTGHECRDSFDLKIIVSERFPIEIPVVEEIGGKIPRDGNFHVNPGGSLCLGSPLRLLNKISDNPTLIEFAKKCIEPFLFAVSHKLEFGGEFIFGELAHGDEGILDDYKDIFSVHNQKQVMGILELLCLKKRIANKRLCPCGCGQRLGKCSLRFKINQFRSMAPRSWHKNNYLSVT